jgi:D-arabinose 1-dehydrogenase-like Zn-dependent alcohol dehydrogenase
LGTLVLVGSAPEDVVIPEYYGEIILKETTIIGSHGASETDVDEALALAVASGSKFHSLAKSKVLRLQDASSRELADIAARLRDGDAVLLSFDGA